ncbi:MAG: hypothetical protein F4W95_06950 [Chloroflexi bacterium]|nr:hypothetical protein [Chloroflexota bacterium]MYD48207.1 hypothetical protein [Chloroflexota bacterium]
MRRRSPAWRIGGTHADSRAGFSSGSNAGTSAVGNGSANGDTDTQPYCDCNSHAAANILPGAHGHAGTYREAHARPHSGSDTSANAVSYDRPDTDARTHTHAESNGYANSP